MIVGVEENGIRLSSGGTEIGEWGDGEYRIARTADGAYEITAENETLRFVPNRPELFAAEVGHTVVELESPEPALEAEEVAAAANGTAEAPAPRPLTRAAFYTLAGTTAALGLWSLLKLIFG